MNLSAGFIGIVDALGTTLLHFVWQGVLIGICYALLRPWCSGIAARYRLGLIALGILAMCPLATLLYLWPAADAVHSVGATTAFGASVLAVADRASAHWQLRAALPWLVAAWLCGVFVLACRSLWQWQRLLRLVREASLPPAEWSTRLARLCREFGLRRRVRLLCSARAVTPMLIGWIKPVVLLPASMLSGFTPQQVELIIAHELGHVCRWDYLANLFQVVLETVLFYHPVVHWISHDVRNARESCCDDLVLSLARGSALTYARTLADLEELRHEDGVMAPALGASGGVLLTRIRRIVGVGETADPLPRTNFWPLLFLLAAIVGMAWRQHVAQTAHAARTLADAPAQTLALVSGNPQLRYAVPAAAPVRALPADVHQETAPEPGKVTIERPHVSVPAAGIERVHNVAAALRSAVPAVEMAEEDIGEPGSVAPVPEIARLSPLHIVAPVYPSRAMESGVEGNVELEFGVDADGRVRDVRVLHAQPAGVFDAAAIAALSEWRFAPLQSAERHTQNFAFTLHGHADEAAKCRTYTGSMICRRPDNS